MCNLCHYTCERLDFLFLWFFKGYKPEVPSHNSFESQLCETLKKHTLFVKRMHGVPGVVVCPSPKKREGVFVFFFLSRRAMVILKF